MKPIAINALTRGLATAMAAVLIGGAALAQGGPLSNSTPTPVVGDKTPLGPMGIDQKPGAVLPTDLLFKDEDGKQVKIGEYFGQRPVLIMPVFYNCQTGCAIIEDAVLKTLAKATKFDHLRVGQDLDVLMYSLNPKEGPDLARSKKALIMNAYKQPNAAAHWHLLTSDLATAKKFSESIGFTYSYDPVKNLINHPVCTVVATVDGRICGYTIGTNFPTKEIEDLIGSAQKNELAHKADQTLMFGCIMIDPATGARTLNIERIVRISMGMMFVFMVGWIAFLSRKHRGGNLIEVTKSGQPKVTS